MCCFSRPVEHVGATQIFARAIDGRQLLAYSMNVRVAEPLAMILPLPVPPRPADDAVRFIDLSGYPRFFSDLRDAFPPFYGLAPLAARGPALAPDPIRLPVHKVGAFEASFVPSLDDFDRLDARFRLSPEVWARLPQYADWGFAVFQLAPQRGLLGGVSDQSVHPMAFEFPRRDSRALFFPTVHVHDGEVHETAAFDHTLYGQVDAVTACALDWTRSQRPLGARVDELRSKGLIRGDADGFAQSLSFVQPNRDIVIHSPRWSGGAELTAGGAEWVARLRGTFANRDEQTLQPEWRAWRESSRERLDEVFAALRDGVRALVERKRKEWTLVPYRKPIPEFWPNYYGPDGSSARPLLISFHPFATRVEPQEVVMSFGDPTSEILADVERELKALLARI
jgi:hypothetical protein